MSAADLQACSSSLSPSRIARGRQIRDAILAEIGNLATEGPSDEEMEKLRNNLFNSAVRSRQSSLFRAQQLAEFTLYDNDPELFDSDLANYLKITAGEIRDAVAKFLDNDNRVLLEIVPGSRETAAAPLEPGEPKQPTAPPPRCLPHLTSERLVPWACRNHMPSRNGSR